MAGFTNPETRRAAMQKSLETRQAKAAARKAEMEARRGMQNAAPVVAPPRVEQDSLAAAAALRTAAAGLPDLDNMFEVPAARRADAMDVKLAGLKGAVNIQRVTTSSRIENDGRIYGDEGRPAQVASVAVDSEESGRIYMYDDNFIPRAIPEHNFRAALHTGKLHFRCPNCGGEHLKEVEQIINGRRQRVEVIDEAPDACPNLEKVMKIRCPECAKRGHSMVIYDRPPDAPGNLRLADEEDELFIQFDAAMDMDPIEAAKKRLKHWLSVHMAWVHPDEALAYGIPVAEIRAATTMGASANTAMTR